MIVDLDASVLLSIVALADRVVRDLATKLAAADALHLATAKNAGAQLATFDQRLADGARMRGVELAGLG